MAEDVIKPEDVNKPEDVKKPNTIDKKLDQLIALLTPKQAPTSTTEIPIPEKPKAQPEEELVYVTPVGGFTTIWNKIWQ